MSEIVTLKFRRGTTSEWVQSTRPLAQGEPGFDVATGALKIGDGMSSWQSLPGFFPSSNLVNYTAGTTPVSIGHQTSSGVTGTVAVGGEAGSVTQGSYAVAVGRQAGFQNQGSAAIAMGIQAGYQNQGAGAVAIGVKAGYIGQGKNAIAIGTGAGTTYQADNSIILNASDASVAGISGQTGACYISPVRNASSSYVMNYNPTTSEVSYSQQLGSSSSGIDEYSLYYTPFASAPIVTLMGAGTMTFDISDILPVIRTFKSNVWVDIDNAYGFQIANFWSPTNSSIPPMTKGYLKTGLSAVNTTTGKNYSILEGVIDDIEQIYKSSSAFGSSSTYTINSLSGNKNITVIFPVDSDKLELIVEWVGIDISTEIKFAGCLITPINLLFPQYLIDALATQEK